MRISYVFSFDEIFNLICKRQGFIFKIIYEIWIQNRKIEKKERRKFIKVIVKGISPSFEKKIMKDGLLNKNFDVKIVENLIKNITVNIKKENIKLPVHMLA